MAKGGRKIRIFSALEVANICGVVNQTTINWIRNGHLKAFTTPGWQYRIYAKDLATFLNNRGMGDSSEALQVLLENSAWDTFLIVAREDISNNIMEGIENILPDFSVYQAHNLFDAGKKAIQEKPSYLLLDTGIPGLDIPEFINSMNEDPAFGKPKIFLLTKSGYQELVNAYPGNLVFNLPFDYKKLENAIFNQEGKYSRAGTA